MRSPFPLVVSPSRLNLNPIDTLTRGSAWHSHVLRRMEGDGWLWSDTPHGNPVDIALGGLGRRQAKAGNITALHQSWRAHTLTDIVSQAGGVAHAQGLQGALRFAIREGQLLALPHISNSLDELRFLQLAAGNKLPVIVHPKEQSLGGKEIRGVPDYGEYADVFEGIHYQLTAELLEPWEVSGDAQSIVNGAQKHEHAHSLDDPVLDLQWFLEERGGQRIADPEGVARVLAQKRRVARYQLNWQPDLAGDPAAVQESLDHALSGRLAKTRQGQILAEGARILGSEMVPVDIEVKAGTLAAAGIHDYIEGNRRLIAAARALTSSS